MNEEVLGFIQGYVMGAPTNCTRQALEREVRTQFPFSMIPCSLRY